MSEIVIKRGDTRNSLKAVLKNAAGNPVDLTGAAVDFRMKQIGKPVSVNRAAQIESAATGEVWVVWMPGETDTVGTYHAEFGVVYADGKRETFPNTGYITIKIMDDLGG